MNDPSANPAPHGKMPGIFDRSPLEMRDGIPLFAADRYWGKGSEADMKAALKAIDESGWKEFARLYGGKFDFTFDESRADWRFPIPITQDSVILDTGAGMGRSSIPLARIAGQVVAFDQSFLRMSFLKRRAKEEGLDNVSVCVADIFSLPFKEKSFDVIAMNGVLEWVGVNAPFADPRDAQVEALKICRKLLKDGGYLYIGIENRCAAVYLRARDHGGLRYTSYMPRWLADPYAKLRQGRGYRTYTYNKNGYEKLLREAGFGDTSFYLPYPGYNDPRIVMPYQPIASVRYMVYALMPSNSFSRRLFKAVSRIPGALQAYRYAFFSFDIIAQK